MRQRVITATPASKRLAAAMAYRLLKVRAQGQNADVEAEVDDSVGDIGALKKAHAIEELANSQRAANVARDHKIQQWHRSVRRTIAWCCVSNP